MWGNNYPGLLDDPNDPNNQQGMQAPYDPRTGPMPTPMQSGAPMPAPGPMASPPQHGMSMGMRSALSGMGQQLAAGGPLNFGSMAAPLLQQMQAERQAAGKPGLLKSFLGRK